MPAVYRVEMAKTGKAGCQNSECKKNGEKIPKGELRFGTLIEIQEHQSWQWKHWGCVTPRNCETWKEITDGDGELVDGLDELPEDCKVKVLRAINQGHVDDEDWKGDVEKNRSGQKGYRTPKKKEKMKDAEAEPEGKSDGEESPTKAKASKPKKRKAKDDDEEDHDAAAEEDDEKPKKGRGRPKKDKADLQDVKDKDTGPKKGRGRPKKEKSPEVDDDEEAAPPAKKSKRSKKAAADDEDGESAKTAKKGRGRPKKKD